MRLDYEVFERALDADAALYPAGTKILLVEKGRKISAISVEALDSTETARLHFGVNGAPWPIAAGKAFGDDGGSTFDDGLFYSIPESAVPANGALLVIVVTFTGN